MFGWQGRGLEVALDTGEIIQKGIDSKILESYLGGRGLGVKLLFEHLKPGVEPLSPANILIFAAGPLTGTKTPAAGRYAVISKSPLTGTIFYSNGGGYWGTALKRAGYDYVLLKGCSSSPVFLLIEGDKVSLQNATALWGKNTKETLQILKGYFPGYKKGGTGIACIGRAGEKEVPFATIMNDGMSTCGRGGLGAVMGSKKLKAVVVKGERKLPVAQKKNFQQCYKDITRLLTASPVISKGLSVFGTPVLVNLVNYMHLMPTKNFRRVKFEEAEKISGEKIKRTFMTKKNPCYGCPIACKSRAFGYRTDENNKNNKAKKIDFSSGNVEIPEYETLAMLGSSCKNSSLESIMGLNALCNDYGIDTISAGGTLSCYSEIIGRELQYSEMKELLEQLCEGEGAGRELRGGAANLAAIKGKPELAMHVKKLELPGYDPRGAQGLALSYATTNRGGCHLGAYMIGPEIFGKPKLIDRLTFSGKAGLLPIFQNFFTALDSLVVCKFISFSVGEVELAAILSAVTGVSFSAESLLQAGERIWNLERLFNLREGFGKEDDTLPARFFSDSADGQAKGLEQKEFEQAREDYYRFRGWTAAGIPTAWKLEQLGIKMEGENKCGVK
ncbi:MAG: aldehyde ferredoxin oxidoreductase family protein [Dethiobacteria bacterium]|jgi:aldehyde:ferredoxin oxidoreductase